MRVATNGCCVAGPDREEAPVSRQAFLVILSLFGALGFFAYAVAFFQP